MRRPARSSGSSSPTAARAAAWPIGPATPRRRRAIFGSAQERLIALDAKTGRLVPQFGQGGFVDMGTTMASPRVGLQGHPDHARRPSPVIRAWNARTGALIWKFDLVAQPGDPNNKTWESDSWKAIGGTNTWGYLTIDDRARHRLRAGLDRRRERLRRRDAARRQPLRHVAGRDRHRDRQAPVAPAAGASRHLGQRSRRAPDADRRDARTARRFRRSRRSPRWACCSSSIA